MDRLRSYLRSLVGPRPAVLLAAVLLVALLVGAFAYELVSSQASSRRQAERSFAVQARITAELTSSLFSSSSAGTEAAAAKAFSGRRPSQAALTATVKRSQLAYALILDSSGRVLAASAGTPKDDLLRPPRTASQIRAALAGQPWLSSLSPGNGAVVEWAFPFQTAFGRRVEVEAFDAKVLFGFLGGYLKESRGSGNQVGYIVDANRRVIADSSGQNQLGDRLSDALPTAAGRFSSGQGERYQVSAPLDGSDWKILLTEPTGALYPALAGSRSWLLYAVLAAFALIGVGGVLLLRRSLIGTARIVSANRQLAELNATLEQRVAERTTDVEQRSEDLARSNSELEQFASVASHDLQEPLRKIRMYCERLPKRLGDQLLPEDAASDVARMTNAAERMQRLIDDLLSFARVGSRHREFEPVDLGTLTHEVVGDLEARIQELGAQVDVGELPVVSADRAQMGQLLQNLISNALKFHRDGVAPVVRVRAEMLPGQPLRAHGESTGSTRCAITVEDNGIGFDQKYAERVFSAFERLHSRSDYEGTGIGLSIARKIAWRHRGELTATSAPGQGSTFTLTLPLPAPATAAVEEAA